MKVGRGRTVLQPVESLKEKEIENATPWLRIENPEKKTMFRAIMGGKS